MRSKTLLTLLFVALIGSFTLVPALKEQQVFQSRASADTTIFFSPASSFFEPVQVRPKEQFSLDITLDPRSNLVSTVKLALTYDPTKLEAVGKNTLVINQNAFPTIVEGPVVNNDTGTIYVTLSVGVDPQRAIRSVTKVATLNMMATQKTGALNALISFDTQTQAYSLAPNDHPFENVIAGAAPAYIAIGNFASTPTPLPPASPTPTPGAVQNPTSVPTPLPNEAVLAFNVLLHGIGGIADNPSQNLELNNKNPLHPTRKIHVSLFDTSNKQVMTKEGEIVYDKNASLFGGRISLGTTLPTGTYSIKIKTDGYLEKRIPSVWHISQGANLTLPTVSLLVGDITQDNHIDVFDYNMLMSCFENTEANAFCGDPDKQPADLNDDGRVNQADFQLLINEIALQNES